MTLQEKSIAKHREWAGKIEIVSRAPLDSREALSLAYTPGVAAVCKEIEKDPEESFSLTRRHNLVAVITDGSAVLGLGDIGTKAAMPVMEGKCALFSAFAGVDAFPLCIATKDVEQFVETVALLADSFGGINLEDIAAPRCFAIEEKLKELLDIPVFHDDQHGTAIVVGAALTNALRVVGKAKDQVKIVINGAGAAGTAIGLLLQKMGFPDIILCDKEGALCAGDPALSPAHATLAERTNPRKEKGSLAEVIRGKDVFIGVSKSGLVTKEMVESMAKGAIVFPMANPEPEILPELALAGGAAVVGTGRSDYPNQINNVLAFPGVFKGALSVRAKTITDEMKVAAAQAIADFVPGAELTASHILPDAFEEGIADAVGQAVAELARKQGLCRI